jgi:crotonobetainyl-CoA:carnitine CoA-transferase CaiB-like acyl-CoA transferase
MCEVSIPFPHTHHNEDGPNYRGRTRNSRARRQKCASVRILSEHTYEILTDLGVSPAELARLRANKVV